MKLKLIPIVILITACLAHGQGTFIYDQQSSITGTIIGQSTAVLIPSGGFTSTVNFIFTNPIPVIAGTTYYFQPVVADNNNLLVDAANNYNYSGGTAYANGAIDPNEDLWFREGVIAVPEPSSALLVLLGSGVLFYVRRRK